MDTPAAAAAGAGEPERSPAPAGAPAPGRTETPAENAAPQPEPAAAESAPEPEPGSAPEPEPGSGPGSEPGTALEPVLEPDLESAPGSAAARSADPAAVPLPEEPSGRRRSARRSGNGALRIPGRVRFGFLGPAVVILLAIVGWPILYSIWLSLRDSTGSKFVGLANYGAIFSDPATLTALKNNVIWLLVAPTIACFLGLVFAVASERITWSTAFKVVIFMPMAISFLAAGVIFELVYQADPNIGIANAVLVGAHDVVSPSAHYPNAFPRTTLDYQQTGAGFTSSAGYRPGTVANIPLVGYSVKSMPAGAAQAAPAAAAPGEITGTVWLDLVYGGGGSPDHLDPGKKGTPGITVDALSGTTVVGSATTAANGTYAISGLSPGTTYTLALPASNFARPYAGLSWLGPDLVTPAIIVAYLWIWAGFAMVLIAAGLTGIPRELQEAARVDGASELQIFRKVTVPMLAPVLLVVLVTLAINVLKIFDLVYIIAPGSTVNVANVLAVQMWSVSFGGAQNQGLGSAIGVFLYILVLPAMYVNIRRIRRERRES
ncbi:MAG TPA: ABC transporter permease subunit [Actinocrinis sp.]|nr:ABC transporter permease subunit [Actinocrinis sp.]